ncbi:MAG: aminoglycoside phosphotransferase family protein [Thermoleophilaceae bacterium]
MSTTPEIPRDDAIPQMRLLLDAEAITPVLQRSLGSFSSIAAVEMKYLRYKQGKSMLVRYEVTIDGSPHGVVALAQPEVDLGAHAAKPRNLELARKVEGRTPAESPLAYDREHDVLVQWTPLDIELPALAEPPERLLELLEQAGVKPRAAGELPRLVHFKPGRRGVLSFGDHYLKVYAEEDKFERAVTGMRAAAALPIRSARCEATVPELNLTVQSFVAGDPPAGAAEVAPEAGAFLAVLHAAEFDVRLTPPAHRLHAVAATASLLASIVPDLESRLQKLMARLESTMPDGPLVLSHGDFHARQMLGLNGDFGVIDFDASCRAPAALDLATYVTTVVRGVEDLPVGMTTLDVLTDAYGSRPRGIPWYLAAVLIRRASIPFRVFRKGWPEQVEARVAAAEAALGL